MRGGTWSDSASITAILAVALLLRIGAAIGIQRHLDAGSQEVCLIPGDADGYWHLSQTIVRGENFEIYTPPRRVMRMPGFPALLAVPQFVFGQNLLAVRIWLALIGTAGCGFVYLLAKELCDPQSARFAAAVIAFSPVHIVFCVLLLSEASFASALTASLWLYIVLQRRLMGQSHLATCGLAIFVGVTMAIATYLRPTWLLVGPVGSVALLFGPKLPVRFAAALLLLLGLFGALLPWGLRNQAVSGHFTWTTFWVGSSLYDGLNPEANGDSEMTFFDRENLLGRMSEYEMDQEYRRRAKEFAVQHPGRVVQLMFIKFSRYWMLWPNAAQFRATWMRAVVFLSSAVLLLPAIYGTWLMRRRWNVLEIAWGPALYFAAIHMLFVGSIRYRLPAEYPLAVLAGVGWAALHRRVRAEGVPPA